MSSAEYADLSADVRALIPPPPKSMFQVRCMDEVERVSLEWVWPGWLPKGKLVILDGDPGSGKSAITTHLAAIMSVGGRLPDGTITKPANVLFIAVEDDPGDTIRPRLEEAGADLTRIFFANLVTDNEGERTPDLERDMAALRELIERHEITFVVLDPLMALLGEKVNAYRDQDIRRITTPLALIAQETGCVILAVRHLTKGGGSNAVYRGGGSIGIIAAARLGMMVGKDPDDETMRVLAVTKVTSAAESPSLRYRVVPSPGDPTIPIIEWHGSSPYGATDLISEHDDDDRSALTEAKEFIRQELADGPREAIYMEKEARRAGISPTTLNRAKRQMPEVTSDRHGFGSGSKWMWEFRAKMVTNSEDGQVRGDDYLQ
jgi:archaellum biogenesis ATPase FlaH